MNKMENKLIFEYNNHSESSYSTFFKTDFKLEKYIDNKFLRKNKVSNEVNLAESTVARHYTNLSIKNHGLDNGFYPLGSCTMKYNPKINERIASYTGFNTVHPLSSQKRIQGTLKLISELKNSLCEIVGMDDMTLSPCAGAHGELTGLYLIKAYFENKNEKRRTVLIPDAAHGTNPASASMAGFKSKTIKSTPEGFVDIQCLKENIDDDTAALMLTNPNTLGIYEKNIKQIVKICKEKDVQLYYDGANLNAFLGIARPGDTGFDVVHLNLHKTFSTPHGGGGPGAGPVGVKKHLIPFLPDEDFVEKGDNFLMKDRGEKSIGKMRAFYTNFSVILKSYAYILSLGYEGLRNSGLLSLLNANYLAHKINMILPIATSDHVMHEFVISLTDICKKHNITIMDFAKSFMDYGIHPPTVSFPLIVHDCLMIEPTETESKETLDFFIDTFKNILNDIETNPEKVKASPSTTTTSRIDEVKAARNPVLKYERN